MTQDVDGVVSTSPASAADLRIAFVAELANPVATSWIRGFAAVGARVVVLDQRDEAATAAQLKEWQVPPDIPVQSITPTSSPAAVRDGVSSALGGRPHIVFAWCGQQVLPAVAIIARALPTVPIILRVETFPNASGSVTEVREIVRFNRADADIHGYAFYSPVMRAMFHQRVPGARGKPAIEMVEPFPLAAYAPKSTRGPKPRADAWPRLIYTGRSDLLWAEDARMARDRMGPFLERVSGLGVHVTVKPDGGVAGRRGLSTYPHFSNAQIFDGSFAAYVSDFDAQLVAYHEQNATVRRRVRTSLSTRLAFAMTATTPLAVSDSSHFMRPLLRRHPFALVFTSPEHLAAQLHDRDLLADLRRGMASANRGFAMETQIPRMLRFIRHVVATTSRTTSVR